MVPWGILSVLLSLALNNSDNSQVKLCHLCSTGGDRPMCILGYIRVPLLSSVYLGVFDVVKQIP